MIKGMDRVCAVGFAILLGWALLIILSPLALTADSLDLGEDGSVGLIDYTDNFSKIENSVIRGLYESGDSMCHQKASRSLFLNGNQMAYCSRDLGIFLGMALGVGVAIFMRVDLKWWWFIVGFVPIGADGGLQLVTSYESNNILRLATGGLAGGVTGLALGMILQEVDTYFRLRRALAEAKANADSIEGEDEILKEYEMPAEDEDAATDEGNEQDTGTFREKA